MSETYRDLPVITTLKTKNGREVVVCKGYDDQIIEELVEKSKEAEIVKRCPRDSEERFKDPKAFALWVPKGGGRIVYPGLNASTGELDRLVWLGAGEFGIKSYNRETYNDPGRLALVASMTDAYATRRYESGESGLGKQHTRAAISDYVRLRMTDTNPDRPKFTGIHLETDIDNLDARCLYQYLGLPDADNVRHGFLPAAEDLSKNRIAMALPLPHMENVIGLDLPGFAVAA